MTIFRHESERHKRIQSLTNSRGNNLAIPSSSECSQSILELGPAEIVVATRDHCSVNVITSYYIKEVDPYNVVHLASDDRIK